MLDWNLVEKKLEELIEEIGCANIESVSKSKKGLRYGQDLAARAVMQRIKEHGVILADEVGLGKTRVALLLMEAVLRSGGTVAAVVPRGLIYQWENEASEFAKTIERPRITKNIKKLTKFEDLFDDGVVYPVALNKGVHSSWPLISQRFGMFSPQTRNLRRFDIFGMIANELKENQNRNNWKRYIELIKKDPGYEQKQNALIFLKKKGLKQYKTLKELGAPINRDRKNQNILQNIVKHNGLADAKKIIRELIGPIDFLVIDEAHKEKGSLAEEREMTNLESLLKEVVEKRGRVLGMTATPIELNVQNWKQLLMRCDIELKDIKENVLINFDSCLGEANKNPDNPKILKKLIDSAGPFQDFLEKYVVRRRRCHQNEHSYLVTGLKEGVAHPYRQTKEVNINVESLSKAWQKAILCYEGVNCAALGRNAENHSDKFLRRNSAAGLIDIDKDESLENVIDPKERRRIFWKNLGNKFARSDDARMKMHPKVQAAADLIEDLLGEKDEKVLVFGTFNLPMRELRGELNWRNYSRRIEEGRILKNDIVSNEEELQNIYKVYKRLFPTGEFSADIELFRNRAKSLHDSYERIQRKLLKITQDKEKDILDIIDQSDDEVFSKAKVYSKIKESDQNIFGKILECLRIDVLNFFVDSDNSLEESSFETSIPTQRILECFREMAQGYLKDICDSNCPLESADVTEDIDGNLIESFKAYLEKFSDETNGFKSSVLCRFMNGDTSWETRRRLQRQFNTKRIAPRVLIAQSMVGREGLNLHKCCRKVVMLHPEWNPGVVEQQIGRVDRIDSLWNKMAESWQKLPECEKANKAYPYIEVYYIVFNGTYDQHHFEVLKKRSIKMNAQLFGALLDNDVLEKIPEGMEDKLIAAAPDFDPCKKRD